MAQRIDPADLPDKTPLSHLTFRVEVALLSHSPIGHCGFRSKPPMISLYSSFFRALAPLDQEQESECAGSETRSGGRLGAMEGLSARLASLRVSWLTAGLFLVLSFAAGYLLTAWLSGAPTRAHLFSR
jgi:hypothetical protein